MKKIPSYAMILAELVAVLEDLFRCTKDPYIAKNIKKRIEELKDIKTSDIDTDQMKKDLEWLKRFGGSLTPPASEESNLQNPNVKYVNEVDADIILGKIRVEAYDREKKALEERIQKNKQHRKKKP